MSESGIVKQALVALARVVGIRMWPQKVRKLPDPMTENAWIQFGVPGMADTSGIAGPEGWRVEIEFKKGKGHRNKTTIERQRKWRAMILKHGGICLQANTAVDAVKLLSFELKRRREANERTNEVLKAAVEWARGYGPWDSGNPDHMAGSEPEDRLYNALVRWKRDSGHRTGKDAA